MDQIQDKTRPPLNSSASQSTTAQSLEVLKPTDDNKNIKLPKKRRRFLKFIITLIIIAVILAAALAITGLYEIPVLSSVLGVNKPKDLGVKISEQALASMKQDVPLKITGESTDYSSGKDIFSGEVAVDAEFTAEEVTSWLHEYQRPDPILTDLQVKQFEGGLEISAMANQYIKAPVYAKVNVDLINPQTISLNIEKGKIGVFSVPEKYLKQAEDFIEDKVNHLINNVPGFSIEEYELHAGYTKFKGTFPATAKPSPNGWADLLNY